MADGNHQAGVESSAISILKRAVELDNSRRFDESLTCYQEGVGLLMQVLKSMSYIGFFCSFLVLKVSLI